MGKKKIKKKLAKAKKRPVTEIHAHPGKTVAKKLSLSQKAVLILFGLAVLASLEIVVRLLPVTTESPAEGDPFVGFSGINPLFVPYKAPDGSLRMKTSDSMQSWFNHQEFAAEKEPGTFRIFSLGGSTTYGRPYLDPTSFSGWLRILLNNTPWSPGKCEVINAGGISYASYRVVVLLKELLSYKPDLFIIYTGHNEFLEWRTYGNILEQPTFIFRTRELLSHLKSYRLLSHWYRNATKSMREKTPPEGKSSSNILSPEVVTLLDRSAGLDFYQRDSVFSRGVFEHFRFNVKRMIRICQENGVPVVFLNPVDNLKDFTPFKSQVRADLNSDSRTRLDRLISEGLNLINKGQFREAIDPLTKAVDLDSTFAEAHFFLGQAYFNSGDIANAKKHFLLARELDVCPLRAQEPIHRILEEETASAGVDLIDLPSLFRQYSPGGILGNEMLVDHIHPSPEGYLMIAAELMDRIGRKGLLPNCHAPDREYLKKLYPSVMHSLPSDYSGTGVLNLAKTLTWAKKYNEVYNLLDRNAKLIENVGEAQFMMGGALANLGAPDKALPFFKKALTLDRDHPKILLELAKLYAALGQADSSMATYDRYLSLYRENEAILNNYGMLLRDLGQKDKALELFKRAQRLAPDSPIVNNNLGLTYSMMKEYPQAIEAFKRALAAAPEDPQAYHNLGVVYTFLGKPEEAEQWFLKVIRINPDHAAARSNLGNIYQNTGRLAQAEEQFRLALIANPNLLAPYVNLALLYRSTGNDSLARAIVRLGLQNFPEEPKLKNLLSDSPKR